MSLVKKFFDWTEKRYRNMDYQETLDGEPSNPFDPIIDLFAMSSFAPRLIYRIFKKYN